MQNEIMLLAWVQVAATRVREDRPQIRDACGFRRRRVCSANVRNGKVRSQSGPRGRTAFLQDP